MDLLPAALGEVERGEARAVGSRGEPGIGKSRLLAELAESGRRRGLLVLIGRAAELERDLPFALLVDAFESVEPGTPAPTPASQEGPDRADTDHTATDAQEVDAQGDDAQDDDAMTRSEEEVSIEPRARPAEHVRLKKYVVTEPVTKTAPVRREEIRVERVPVEDDAPDETER